MVDKKQTWDIIPNMVRSSPGNPTLYFKHMEYIRIYILDIKKNEKGNIGKLKRLNLTLIFDKSFLKIVPRKHFFHLFFTSFNHG